MSDSPLQAAQARLERKRLELGIKWGPQRARLWAKDRMLEWYARHPEQKPPASARGRQVRCVNCGNESRVETNRRRRLKTLACDVDLADDDAGRCGGRLRPLNWFRGSPDAL